MSEPSFWEGAFTDAPEEPEGDVEWVQEEEIEEDPTSFDATSLLNLGKLSARMDVRGHEVSLRTLTMDEELEIGLLVSKYENTRVEGQALATACVAAAVESIDGKPFVSGLGPDESPLTQKFHFVRKRLYWPVIKAIYEEGYIPLMERQVQALEETRKK